MSSVGVLSSSKIVFKYSVLASDSNKRFVCKHVYHEIMMLGSCDYGSILPLQTSISTTRARWLTIKGLIENKLVADPL